MENLILGTEIIFAFWFSFELGCVSYFDGPDFLGLTRVLNRQSWEAYMTTMLHALPSLSPYLLLLVFVLGLVGTLVLVVLVHGLVKPGERVDLDISWWRGIRLSVSKSMANMISPQPNNKGDPPERPSQE